MSETKDYYLISDQSINEIIDFACDNPDYDMHTEVVDEDWLSVIFNGPNDESKIWELPLGLRKIGNK